MQTKLILIILGGCILTGCTRPYSCTCEDESANTTFSRHTRKSKAGSRCQAIATEYNTKCAVGI